MSAQSHRVSSRDVIGAVVFGADDQPIGTIDNLIIETISGRIIRAVVAVGGVAGLGARAVGVAWSALVYDQALGGYRTGAPIEDADIEDQSTLSLALVSP